jgi:hypothetical protein
MALVLHPEDAAMPFVRRAAIALEHPDACPPAQKIVRFVGSFCSRYRTLPSGCRPWPTAQDGP